MVKGKIVSCILVLQSDFSKLMPFRKQLIE